jgi:uncharacterized protein YdeI (YjbR/CyaY-like superfamily)
MAMKRNDGVEGYFGTSGRWEAPVRRLRAIALGCRLTEELKWGCPCYTLEGRNVVLIHVLKEYCALLFFKGALLKNARQLLVQQTANVQAARQLRFTTLAEVVQRERIVRATIREAIAVEQAGLQVTRKKTAEYALPAEFAAQLRALPALKKAFHALTPGRQRAYLLHFSSAKQAKTRAARVGKCLPRILAGKGLDD